MRDVAIYHSSKSCDYIINHANFAGIVEKRKNNYAYLLNALSGQPNIDLSLNCNESDFIPYMVIGVLANPELHHPLLIEKKLPIWRWEHLYPSQCSVAKEYSKSIIQIPCHQQLSSEELSALADGIIDCLQV